MDRLHYIGQVFSEHDIIILGGENQVKKLHRKWKKKTVKYD